MAGVLERRSIGRDESIGRLVRRHINEVKAAIRAHNLRRAEADYKIGRLVRGESTPHEISAIVRIPRSRLRPLHRQRALEIVQARREFHAKAILLNKSTIKKLEEVAKRKPRQLAGAVRKAISWLTERRP